MELRQTKRVLIIDDEPEIRSLIRKSLVREGYEVAEARDGFDGMRLFRNQPADLIITDIFMPNKEGLDVIREIKQEFPAVKIIAISGGAVAMSNWDCLHMAQKFGANGSLSKPFTIAELTSIVRDVISHA